MRPHVDDLRKAGVEPYVIGSGTPAQARDFARLVEVDGVLPILSDEKLASYRAAGMKRTMLGTLSLRAVGNYVRSYKQFKQGKTMGDPWQLGGAFIVTPAGDITYAHVGQYGGDHPDPALLVAEARKATK